jgi:vitamin B12 transporter
LHKLKVTAALLAAFAPALSHAAEAPDIVVTATGAAATRQQIGQSVSVLTASDIALRQMVSVADLLAHVPGVTVTRNGPTGGFAAVRIRGAEGEQTLALIDGIKVNDPSSPGGGFDFGTLLTGNIARIEVLRGPNSVPWGSEAIGGVVNIVTPAPDKAGWHATGNAELGSGGSTRLVTNLTSGSGPVRASLGGGWFDESLFSSFRYGTEKDGLRQYAANGRVEADLSDNVGVDLRGWYAHSRADIDGYAPPDYLEAIDTAEFTLVKQAIGYAGINANWDGFRNRVAATLSDINRDTYFAPGDTAPEYLNHGRTERLEYRGDWRLTSGLRALLGAEHERTRSFDGYATYRTHVTSAYLQAMATPFETLTVTTGLRLDDHATFGSHWTPSVHIAFQARPTTRFRAAYGDGFKAPTLFQLYSYYGNTSLNPEIAHSGEFGVDQSLADDRIKLSASYFRRTTKNQIDFISCTGRTTGICANRPNGTYDNRIATRAEGVELSADAAVTDALTLSASYGYLKATDRRTGDPLPRRPHHQASADLDWTSPSGIRLGTSLSWRGQSHDTDYATYAPVVLSSYALVGLRASLPITDQLELYGRVENLFDTRYEIVSGYGTPGRTVHAGIRGRF